MKAIDPTETDKPWDVIVIGAGPAGCTTAALLAEKGRRVLVLEKEKFPRYHIGESMMPFCWYTLNRLGLAEKMDEIGFTQKLSVQFVATDGMVSRPFYFFQHYDHPSATTWQVERMVFDQMLMDKARGNGAVVLEETKVLDTIRDESDGRIVGVRSESRDGRQDTWFAPVTVDATGRDALMVSKNRWRSRDPMLNKVAIWTYYEDAVRDPGLDAGSTTVAYLPGKGWFWYIPMRDNRVSVGVVAERDYLFRDTRDPAEIMAREIHENKWIESHLAPARQVGEYWVTGEYSYRSKYCADDGAVLVGDAFGFLDPVFSSGVFLALKSGELAADAIDEALTAGDVSAGRFQHYGEQVCLGMERMRKIVYAFYNENFSFGKLVKAHPELRPKLTDLLIGNVYGMEFDDLFAAIEEICALPADLDYGMKIPERGAVAAA
ncbi:MAG: FAD-dependent oxidoreductase [Verrucomicrobiales bacterium]|nr:FAD-dependent oxidoreductase [Verrucomicrobiales bacterium]